MMKKRRFLSLALALAMTASLSAPAFAAQETVDQAEGGEYLTVDVADLMGDPIDPKMLEAMPIPVSAEDAGFDPTVWQELLDNAGEGLLIAPNPLSGEDEADQPSEYDLFLDAFLADYTAAHPQEYAAFDADAWFAENYGGWWTVEEYMGWNGNEGETLKEAMWRSYVYGLADKAWDAKEVEEYRAAHPGELESVGVAELLIRRGYSDPMTRFMEDYGYATRDEAMAFLYHSYVSEREWCAGLHELAEEYRAEYPQLWASFDDAAYFAEHYGDQYTGVEYMRDNGLWTYDEFVDQLFVDYAGSQISPEVDPDWDWRPDLTLAVNGATLWDSSIYAEDGVSYLPADELNAILDSDYTEDTPIRDAALANGWDVVWNAENNQVVLLNKAEITAGWDFTNFDAMMNQMLKGIGYEEGKPFHIRETADITLTRFNTLDGDENHTFKITADTVMKNNVINLTLSADLSQLLGLIPQATPDQMEPRMPEGTFRNLKTLLSGCKIRVILNMNTGMTYVNAPILSLKDDTITDQTWFCLNSVSLYNAAAMGTVSDLLAGNWSTADYLYGALLRSSAAMPYGAEISYQSAQMMGAMLDVMMGNEAVTERNGAYTWKVNTTTLEKMMKATLADVARELGEEGLEQAPAVIPSISDFFKEYNVTVTVDRNGGFTASAALRLNPEGIAKSVGSMAALSGGRGSMGIIGGADGPTSLLVSGGLGSLLNAFDFRLTGESQGTAKHATGTAELHVKNQFKMVIQEVSNLVKDTPAVLSDPPAGAVILNVENRF